jgi:hypothetical protein
MDDPILNCALVKYIRARKKKHSISCSNYGRRTSFFCFGHPAQKLISRQKIDQAEIVPLFSLSVQKDYCWYPFDPEFSYEALIDLISLLGEINLNHGEILFRLFSDFRIVKSDFVQLSAGGTPRGVKINNNRPFAIFRC